MRQCVNETMRQWGQLENVVMSQCGNLITIVKIQGHLGCL